MDCGSNKPPIDPAAPMEVEPKGIHRLPMEILLMIFNFLSLPEIMDFVRASRDLRSRFGTIPEFCNSIIRSRFRTENAFFESRIVNGFLVPSIVKFDSLLDIVHEKTLRSMRDRYYCYFRLRPIIEGAHSKDVKTGYTMLKKLQPQHIYESDESAFDLIFKGNPLYLLYLAEYSSTLRNLQALLLRISNGRGFSLDPKSLYEALLQWTTYCNSDFENTRITLIPKQSSSHLQQDVALADLPVSFRAQFQYYLNSRSMPPQGYKELSDDNFLKDSKWDFLYV